MTCEHVTNYVLDGMNWQKCLCALCVSGNWTRFEIILLLNVHWILCMFSLSVIKLLQELHIKFWIDETWNSIERTHVINWIEHRFAIDMNISTGNKSTNFSCIHRHFDAMLCILCTCEHFKFNFKSLIEQTEWKPNKNRIQKENRSQMG